MAGMVTRAAAGAPRMEANPADVARVRGNLNRFDRELSAGMRAEGNAWGRALAAGLDRAARGAPAPQTRRFAGAAEVDDTDNLGDQVGATVVIDADSVDFYNPGAVLQATEHGSRLACFQVGRGGPYWIQPTVRKAEGLAVAGANRTTSALVARCNAGG
jgi:hypothetical protein